MHKGRQLRNGKVAQHCELHTNSNDTGSSIQRNQFLGMPGLVIRNAVVECPCEELYQTTESDIRMHAIKAGTAATMKQYQHLLARCIERDSQLFRPDSSIHGKSEEWGKFCKDCTVVVILRDLLYNVQPYKLGCRNEEEVRKFEAIVRTAGKLE
jgi:hypothetical protein